MHMIKIAEPYHRAHAGPLGPLTLSSPHTLPQPDLSAAQEDHLKSNGKNCYTTVVRQASWLTWHHNIILTQKSEKYFHSL